MLSTFQSYCTCFLLIINCIIYKHRESMHCIPLNCIQCLRITRVCILVFATPCIIIVAVVMKTVTVTPIQVIMLNFIQNLLSSPPCCSPSAPPPLHPALIHFVGEVLIGSSLILQPTCIGVLHETKKFKRS